MRIYKYGGWQGPEEEEYAENPIYITVNCNYN